MSWKVAVVAESVVDLRQKDEKSGNVYARSLGDLLRAHKKDPTIYNRAPSIFYQDNPQQETQLLFGEQVEVAPFSTEWCRVRALEQKKFKNGVWQATVGFIGCRSVIVSCGRFARNLTVLVPWTHLYQAAGARRRVVKEVSFGTCLSGLRREGDRWIVDTPVGMAAIAATAVLDVAALKKLSNDMLRARLVGAAKLFLGCPYVWGGCCAWTEAAAVWQPNFIKGQITGVDCSGLMYLVFKVHGLLIPRNAHDQFLKCDVVPSGDLLLPGDLIFLANPQQNPPHVYHVMMYVGKDNHGKDLILEAHGGHAPYGVRVIPTSAYHQLEKRPLKELRYGSRTQWNIDGCAGTSIIYFGTFFTPRKVCQLRQAFSIINKQGRTHPGFAHEICYNK